MCMLIEYEVNGYKTFNRDVKISFKSDNYIKSNQDLIFKETDILKSALIYGPNNTGKSCFVESLSVFKKIVEEGRINKNTLFSFDFNLFNEEKQMEFKIKFLINDFIYNYVLGFTADNCITNEKLEVNNKVIFDRFKTNPDSVQNIIDVLNVHKDTLVLSTLPEEYIKYMNDIKTFFDNMIIIRHIDFNEIINEYSSLNKKDKTKFVNIMKNADISIDNMELASDEINMRYNELRLFSQYKMNNVKKSMPSVISDSDGTKAYMYYILKIMKVINQGGLLVIDEIDRSLHTLLTKSILSIINNENNNSIQLLATTHDLQLLDCKYLFRKDQIWFTYKDSKQVYLYSLNEFKANRDPQIRRIDVVESYLKGMFGALPHPDVEDYIYDDK